MMEPRTAGSVVRSGEEAWRALSVPGESGRLFLATLPKPVEILTD